MQGFHVVTGIFGRAGAQLGAGVALGLAMDSAVEWLGPGGTMGDQALVILRSVVALMFTVGLLAGGRSRVPRPGGAADGSPARGVSLTGIVPNSKPPARQQAAE